MRIFSKLFGHGKHKSEESSQVTIEELGIRWKLPVGWKMGGRDLDYLKDKGLVGWLHPSGLEDSVRISITQEESRMSVEDYARAAMADLQRHDIYEGAEFGDVKVIRRGESDWAEFTISLQDDTTLSFHITKSPDDMVCYSIACTGTSRVLYNRYQNDMSLVLDTFLVAEADSLEDLKEERDTGRVLLWLRDSNDANNRDLLSMLLIKENLPKWAQVKALMGDYRVEMDHQLVKERGGGCVVIFTR